MARRKYEIELTTSAARSLRKLEREAQVRIAHAIDSLANNPRPRDAVKLSGEDGIYRIRTGDYRVIYSIFDDRLLVLVIALGHRRDIYSRRR